MRRNIARGLGVLGDLVARGLGWFMPSAEAPEAPTISHVGSRYRRLRFRQAEEERRLAGIRKDDEDWFILD